MQNARQMLVAPSAQCRRAYNIACRGLHATAVVLVFFAAPVAAQPAPSELIADGPKTRPVAMPDGKLRAFYASRGQIVSIRSADGGQTWSAPHVEFKLPMDRMGGGLSMLDADGEIHLILTHARGEGKPAETRFIDLWHCRTTNQRQGWTNPRRIWEGYCGAVMDVKQVASGRILVPFAAWKKPGEEVAPNTGSNYTTVVYSDDRGETWQLSPAKLTSPCRAGYNGNNYGAIEPTILELGDGRIWMLMRTQAGFLYESFSNDGVDWTPAEPSRFHSSTSPAALARLPNGRILVVWNNCEMPPRHEGDGVYGGRDALHAAVSADEGKTWQGFREVYSDQFRNDSQPRRGDRGTAYPVATVTENGQVVIVSGQGNRRTTILLDPDWLNEKRQASDFAAGLDQWHVWKHFGPASGFWRDRCAGARLIDHPTKLNESVLHVRRPDDKDADCASWNFAGRDKGRLTMRIMPRQGFAGTDVCLNDRFFNPGDPRGEVDAVFHLHLPANGQLTDDVVLQPDQWATLTFDWDLSAGRCDVMADDRVVFRLPQRHPAFGGVSYLRVRSAAQGVDEAGLLIESVEVESAHDSQQRQDARAIPVNSVPYRIEQSGTYRLADDLVYPAPDGAAITIGADEVTLDMNGKTLRGSAGSSSGAIGVMAIDRRGIHIANGQISGFYFGIDIRATDSDTQTSMRHRVVGVRAEGNWYFAVRLVGSQSVICDCAISDTGGSTRDRHTIPHGVRLVGQHNVMRDNRICDLRLGRFPEGKGEVVGVHFDRAKNSVLEDNVIVELDNEKDDPAPADDAQPRRFGVWVNGGPNKDTFLYVRNNRFAGFVVPLAFTPGTDGQVRGNVFHQADAKPIRGKPASQLADNVSQSGSPPGDGSLPARAPSR